MKLCNLIAKYDIENPSKVSSEDGDFGVGYQLIGGWDKEHYSMYDYPTNLPPDRFYFGEWYENVWKIYKTIGDGVQYHDGWHIFDKLVDAKAWMNDGNGDSCHDLLAKIYYQDVLAVGNHWVNDKRTARCIVAKKIKIVLENVIEPWWDEKK